ncbi:hypothetical protein FIBSPDRAFT_832526 [Athelia psychrophila]|uniref:Uncharacterized protein n=1 Tax=Athelia psychrophila TaxID=1759441 RepID=A0A166EGS9_9AGAM|nr:hypothetical protein FIBSPDRAFT_832526 [Fibularhizoctonia sp. CBS 109695]
MAMATFISNSDNTTFWVVADNSTVAALITTIDTNCTSYLSSSSSSSPVPLSSVSNTSAPQPAQAVEYYRASSVVLSLDGYNNSAGPNTPLPSTIDAVLLSCMNYTIGESVPLVNGGASSWASPTASMLCVIWAILFGLGAIV